MEDGFDIEAPDLRGLIDRVKAADPKLATGIRRALRDSMDEIIADQRAILSGAKPGSIKVASSSLRLVTPRNGRKPYFAKRNTYELGEERDGGVSDLRQQIADGLRGRVTAGKTRQAVSVKTTGPRVDGYNMARVWEKPKFRHPVYGRGFVWQQGKPYFFDPIRKNLPATQQRIADIIDDTIKEIAQ